MKEEADLMKKWKYHKGAEAQSVESGAGRSSRKLKITGSFGRGNPGYYHTLVSDSFSLAG